MDGMADGGVAGRDLKGGLASDATYYTSTEDAISRTKGRANGLRSDDGDVEAVERTKSDYYLYDADGGGIEHREDIDGDIEDDITQKMGRRKSKKRKKAKKKKMKLKKKKRSRKSSLRLNLEALNDQKGPKGERRRRHSAEIKEVELTSTSTGRMNQEIIHILTELPLMLKQISKKMNRERIGRRLEQSQKAQRRRHPAAVRS